MAFYDKTRRLVVGNYDTFAIPFVIKNHVPLANEKFIFTIRRVLDTTKRMGRPPEKGEIVFQQVVTYNQLTFITHDGVTVGCSFYITALKEEAANIPEGINAYDLAVVDDNAKTEIELIPPSEFIVGEVLRYG